MKNTKTIEIGALRIFAAITEADTLTQAAERLGITQSAVSQTLKQIELQTGTQLVNTRSRPIKLTPSGQVLKGYAQQILNDTQRMLADVRMASKGGMLPLNIGMIDSFCDVAGLQFMQQVKPRSGAATRFLLLVGLPVAHVVNDFLARPGRSVESL